MEPVSFPHAHLSVDLEGSKQTKRNNTCETRDSTFSRYITSEALDREPKQTPFFFFLLSKVIKSGKIWSRGTAFHIQRISPLVFSGLASLADEVAEGEGTPHCSDGEGWEP